MGSSIPIMEILKFLPGMITQPMTKWRVHSTEPQAVGVSEYRHRNDVNINIDQWRMPIILPTEKAETWVQVWGQYIKTLSQTT